MHKKLIIFDFDGTLADVESIMLSLYNQLAGEYGFDPITDTEISALKNLSAREFLKQKVKLPWWRIPSLMRKGLKEYSQQRNSINLFTGIPELLGKLHTAGYTLAIISSNDVNTIAEILSRSNINNITSLTHSSLFNKDRVLKREIRRLGYTRERALYIGDEVRDAEAAHKAGVDCISVTWGLNSKEALEKINEHTAENPQEILTLLHSF